ncbi:hypothetical protein KSP40_PGU001804 [Platanthera guangdongensis]|uniref:Uncharacterized protein n=1 Tax=Platanthera guangdongensis TaxID=2320717 RepID=A0ABR2MP09_9ASPA
MGGLIRSGASPFSSSVLLVRKTDDSWLRTTYLSYLITATTFRGTLAHRWFLSLGLTSACWAMAKSWLDVQVDLQLTSSQNGKVAEKQYGDDSIVISSQGPSAGPETWPDLVLDQQPRDIPSLLQKLHSGEIVHEAAARACKEQHRQIQLFLRNTICISRLQDCEFLATVLPPSPPQSASPCCLCHLQVPASAGCNPALQFTISSPLYITLPHRSPTITRKYFGNQKRCKKSWPPIHNQQPTLHYSTSQIPHNHQKIFREPKEMNLMLCDIPDLLDLIWSWISPSEDEHNVLRPHGDPQMIRFGAHISLLLRYLLDDEMKGAFKEKLTTIGDNILQMVLSRSRELKTSNYDEKPSDVAEKLRLQSLQKATAIQWLCFTPTTTVSDFETISSKLLIGALMHSNILFREFALISMWRIPKMPIGAHMLLSFLAEPLKQPKDALLAFDDNVLDDLNEFEDWRDYYSCDATYRNWLKIEWENAAVPPTDLSSEEKEIVIAAASESLNSSLALLLIAFKGFSCESLLIKAEE